MTPTEDDGEGLFGERESDAGESSEGSERNNDSTSSALGHDEFVLLTINHQNRLFAYILSLVLDRDRASDILQQVNLVLLEKKADFRRGTSFFAWGARIAYYEVLAERRRRVRDRHLFSDELLAVVASESLKVNANLESRIDALRECLDRLSADHRELLMQRYRPGGRVDEIAASMGKTPGAISATLHRLRSMLIDCLQRKLRSTANA